MSKLIALYKTYRGGEWLGASLLSVQPLVDGIVMAVSKRPWRVSGDAPPENCSQAVSRFRKLFPEVPVVTVAADVRSQNDHVSILGHEARRQFGDDVIGLVVDSDEVWDYNGLATLKRCIQDGGDLWVGRIWEHVGRPQWAVRNKYHTLLAARLRPDSPYSGRFIEVKPPIRNVVTIRNAELHHFGYVRMDPMEIPRKIDDTLAADGVRENAWLYTIWPDLPAGRNIHPDLVRASAWRSLVECDPAALPSAIWRDPVSRRMLSMPWPDALTEQILADERRWRGEVQAASPAARAVPTRIVEYTTDRAWAALEGCYPTSVKERLANKMEVSIPEIPVLVHWGSCVPPGGSVLEIGSARGGSMALLMASAPLDATITCVDPYTPYTEVGLRAMENTLHGLPEDLFDTAEDIGVSHRLTLLRMPSDAAAEHLQGRKFDLVFVDGNHSYEWIRGDLDRYWPMVKPGGRLIVHDYRWDFPGVVKAVDEWAPQGVDVRTPVHTTLLCRVKANEPCECVPASA